jgi:hypothetical protein
MAMHACFCFYFAALQHHLLGISAGFFFFLFNDWQKRNIRGFYTASA